MKQYLLSTFAALIFLTGILASEALAQNQSEPQKEAQNEVAAQPQAQPLCGKRAEFVSQLKTRYAEKPVSVGLASNGVIIEVFAAHTGSFSILVTRPEGVSCLVTSGDNWQDLPTQKAEIKI